MNGRLRVLVSGGGIAGLTCAAALSRRGIEVRLIERKDELKDEGGVGLTLVANALRALNEIGVAQLCIERGMPSDEVAFGGVAGVAAARQTLPRIGGPAFPAGTGIRRPVLHAILADAARTGAQISCGTHLLSHDETENGLVAHLSDGTSGNYDLLVVAEGLYSRTRAGLVPDVTPVFTGQAVWRAETPLPAGMDCTHLFLGGPQGVVGICPIAQDMSYMYIVQAAAPRERRDEAALHIEMREELRGYSGLVQELATSLDRADKVNYRPLEWLLAPRPWGKGRVVLIGDAAHANPPVLAQGAAMGIEDAVVLAEELDRSRSSVPDAIEAFLSRRYDRAKRVVDASCALAQAEVDHREDLNVGEVMRDVSMMLAQPI